MIFIDFVRFPQQANLKKKTTKKELEVEKIKCFELK